MKLNEIKQGDTFKTEDGKLLLASDPWAEGERLAIGLGGTTPMGSAHWFDMDEPDDQDVEKVEVACVEVDREALDAIMNATGELRFDMPEDDDCQPGLVKAERLVNALKGALDPMSESCEKCGRAGRAIFNTKHGRICNDCELEKS